MSDDDVDPVEELDENDEISQMIQALNQKVDEFEAKIERAEIAATKAEQEADEITEWKEEAESELKELKALHVEAQTEASAVATHRKTAASNAGVINDWKEQVEILTEQADAEIAKLEVREKEYKQLRQKIESLLPGATSTGLAEAFMKRRASFVHPRRYWTFAAIAPIVALLLVGLLGPKGFWELFNAQNLNMDLILEGLLMRLPVAGPLVWLAIYSGRYHLLNARLEEEYAYKEAVSKSFEGYKREMESILKADEDSDALENLCTNVLATIARDPGRLYDKKHQDFTPVNAAVDLLDDKKIDLIQKLTDVETEQIKSVLQALVSVLNGTAKR